MMTTVTNWQLSTKINYRDGATDSNCSISGDDATYTIMMMLKS